MQSQKIGDFKSQQFGFSAVLICALLAIGLSVAAFRMTAQINMDSYHSPNKVKIEMASQLSHSGLKYSKYVLADGDRVLSLFQPFQSNKAITLQCSSTVALPDDLLAVEQVYTMPSPVSNHEIKINGVIAPYDCNLPISNNNYRLTLEIVGAIDCSLGADRADSCVTRSIVQTAYAGQNYNTIIKPPPVETTTQTSQVLTCPTGPFTPATPELEKQILAVCAKEGVKLEDYTGAAPTITAPPVVTTTVTTPSTAPSSGSSSAATNKDNTVGM